jgi:hypothetical protein
MSFYLKKLNITYVLALDIQNKIHILFVSNSLKKSF